MAHSFSRTLHRHAKSICLKTSHRLHEIYRTHEAQMTKPEQALFQSMLKKMTVPPASSEMFPRHHPVWKVCFASKQLDFTWIPWLFMRTYYVDIRCDVEPGNSFRASSALAENFKTGVVAEKIQQRFAHTEVDVFNEIWPAVRPGRPASWGSLSQPIMRPSTPDVAGLARRPTVEPLTPPSTGKRAPRDVDNLATPSKRSKIDVQDETELSKSTSKLSDPTSPASSAPENKSTTQVPDMVKTSKKPLLWSATEEVQLMAARDKGYNWDDIRQKYFPHRSGASCARKYQYIRTKNKASKELSSSPLHPSSSSPSLSSSLSLSSVLAPPSSNPSSPCDNCVHTQNLCKSLEQSLRTLSDDYKASKEMFKRTYEKIMDHIHTINSEIVNLKAENLEDHDRIEQVEASVRARAKEARQVLQSVEDQVKDLLEKVISTKRWL